MSKPVRAESKTPAAGDSSAAHTPTPWVVWSEENSEGTEYSICHVTDANRPFENDDGHICVATAQAKTRSRAKANAEFIVRAANAHQPLLEAVKAMQKACDEWAAEFTQKKRAANWGIINDAYVKAERAIQLAEKPHD